MSTALMPRRKDKRSEASRAIAKAIIDQYQPSSAEEMQDALRDIFGPMFEAMLQGEMDDHLGYEANDHGVFCKHFLQKSAKSFCRLVQLHFVGKCNGFCRPVVSRQLTITDI